MKTLTFSNLQDIGINPLTGEACAYSMRTLCDLSYAGAELMREYLGIPDVTHGFNPNWNSFVGTKPALFSMMIDRDAFSRILIFALFREGYKYVYGSKHDSQFTGYNDEDLQSNDALREYHDKIRSGEYAEGYPMLCVWVNPKATSTAPSVGSRNVHQATGRTE